jgi:hypothetical protein
MLAPQISFENIDEIRKSVDPKIFAQAVGSTIRQLSDKAEVQIARAIQARYPIKRATIRQAVQKHYDNSDSLPARILRYRASRISLRHYATKSPRPAIKTTRGIRYGAKVKDRKGAPPRIVPGGFFGTAKSSGSSQIFARVSERSDSKLKKLTGPSVSQLVRGESVQNQVAQFVRENADQLLAKNLDHFQKRRIGVR